MPLSFVTLPFGVSCIQRFIGDVFCKNKGTTKLSYKFLSNYSNHSTSFICCPIWYLQWLFSFCFRCLFVLFFFTFLPINNPQEWRMSSEIGHLPGFFCRNLQLTLQMKITSNEYFIIAQSKSVCKYPISIGQGSFEKAPLESFKYSTINIHRGYHAKLQNVKRKR